MTSPMRRALETTATLSARAGIERERIHCEPELFELGGYFGVDGVQAPMSAAQIEAEFALTCRGEPSEHRGRETEVAARARVERVVAWAEAALAARGREVVVVVSHGELMSRWLRRWLQLPDALALGFVHANTGITTLSWARDEGTLIESINVLTHLPPGLRTGADIDNWWSCARSLA